jgi:hypothetical protein
LIRTTTAIQTYYRNAARESLERAGLTSHRSFSLSRIGSEWEDSLSRVRVEWEEVAALVEGVSNLMELMTAPGTLGTGGVLITDLEVTPLDPSWSDTFIAYYRRLRAGMVALVIPDPEVEVDMEELLRGPIADPCPLAGCTSDFTVKDLTTWLQRSWSQSESDMEEVYGNSLPEAWCAALTRPAAPAVLRVTAPVPDPPVGHSPWDEVSQFSAWPSTAKPARSTRSPAYSLHPPSFDAPWLRTLSSIAPVDEEDQSVEIHPSPHNPDPTGWTPLNCK